MDAQRELLAQLMSPLLPDSKKDYRDQNVCKYHLVAFCPNELFMNTKVDLGRCVKIHDDKLSKEYHTSLERIYDDAFYEYLSKLVNDVERTIKRGHSRLDHTSDADDVREKILILEQQIQPYLPDICELGESGKVAEAMDFYYHLLKLGQELDVARQSDPEHESYRPDKRMEVCQVCGALLANDSTGARIDAHMVGKQHTGYQRIRKTLEEQAKKVQKNRQRKEFMNQSNPEEKAERRDSNNGRDRRDQYNNRRR